MKAKKTARPHLISIALLVGLGLMLVSTHNVEHVRAVASTIPVASGDVAGLIAAINTANNESTNPGPDTIELASSGMYAFTGPHNFEYGPNALPPITSEITINGNGAVLDSTATVRLRFFYVSGGLSFDGTNGLPGGKLVLRDLTLRHGKARGGDAGNGGGGAGMGGAIFNQGELT
jgi:hypothetical protein